MDPVMKPGQDTSLIHLRGSNILSWKPCQGEVSKLNLPDYSSVLTEPEVQTTVLQPHSSRVKFITTCSCSSYKGILQASRFKNQESSRIKDKDFRNSDNQGDAKYEHVGQDTRLQDGKDDEVKQGKVLKISEPKTMSKDDEKGSRSKITQHERNTPTTKIKSKNKTQELKFGGDC
ncbi:hypothetical protein Tco_1411646 [Tanacetum coccineum]